MPEQPDMPPVGELVHFVDRQNFEAFGYWDGQSFNAIHPEMGTYSMGSGWVAECRRVLVLSESGTREVVINALRRQTGPESLAADADAILSALREAAIR